MGTSSLKLPRRASPSDLGMIAPSRATHESSNLGGERQLNSSFQRSQMGSIELFNRVLADFAQHFGVGKNKRIILVLDRAGWHTSERVEIPEGIHLLFLPPYSPELQPAERLWPVTNEPIANRCFESLDELEVVLFDRCRRLLQQQDLIRGLTFFHWWPRGAESRDRTPTI